MNPFESKARRLFQADLKELEYASTIVFFREKGHDWPTSVERMCRFKKLDERESDREPSRGPGS